MTAGVYKSAILLASLGEDLAAQVLKHMDEREVELLVREMVRLGQIGAEARDQVLEEFGRRLRQNADTVSGAEYARSLLERALGPEPARRILGELEASDSATPPLATILERTPPESLAALVLDEHPQLIALLVGQLSVERAAAVLAALPAEVQGPVATRLAEMEAPAPIALQALERCLGEKLRGVQGVRSDEQAGPRRVADILAQMRRSAENLVFAALEQHSPDLAQKVNQYRLSFEDLLKLEGRTLQRILRDVDAETLRLAIKGLDEERRQVLYANMSERAATQLKDDLETMGPTRLRDVEAAQQKMVAVARALRENGEIKLPIGSEAEGEGDDPYV